MKNKFIIASIIACFCMTAHAQFVPGMTVAQVEDEFRVQIESGKSIDEVATAAALAGIDGVSLVSVMISQGISPEIAVAVVISAMPDQTTAVVAAAIALSPEKTAEIVASASTVMPDKTADILAATQSTATGQNQQSPMGTGFGNTPGNAIVGGGGSVSPS